MKTSSTFAILFWINTSRTKNNQAKHYTMQDVIDHHNKKISSNYNKK